MYAMDKGVADPDVANVLRFISTKLIILKKEKLHYTLCLKTPLGTVVFLFLWYNKFMYTCNKCKEKTKQLNWSTESKKWLCVSCDRSEKKTIRQDVKSGRNTLKYKG
jgi:hypothetical protein